MIGSERFITGAVMLASGNADLDHVRHEIQWDREMAIGAYGPKGDLKVAVDEIMRDLEDGDTFRALFGKLTGRCGCCGKTLTDLSPSSSASALTAGDTGEQRAEARAQ